jgi:hypothetical protein
MVVALLGACTTDGGEGADAGIGRDTGMSEPTPCGPVTCAADELCVARYGGVDAGGAPALPSERCEPAPTMCVLADCTDTACCAVAPCAGLVCGGDECRGAVVEVVGRHVTCRGA